MSNKDGKNNNNKLTRIQVLNNGDGTYTKKIFEGDKLIREETDTHENHLNSLIDIRKKEIDEESSNDDTNIDEIINPIESMLRSKKKKSTYKKHDNRKLREFLNRLDDQTCDEDYKDTDLYQLGFEDGETMSYELASQKYQQELRSLRTLIDALILSK